MACSGYSSGVNAAVAFTEVHDMKHFMGTDFLLSTDVSRRLFHEVAESLPIIDYHCHLSPREIWEDKRFANITQAWLGGDHYKWRLMRSAGVEERLITGDAPDHDKFLAWASVLGKAIGNPLYHWSHMELQRYFNCQTPLNEHTAEEVWEKVNQILASPEYSARGFIRMSRVETICTTDGPLSSLEYHEKLFADKSMKTVVLPAWRPDGLMNVDSPGYAEIVKKLESVTGISIGSFADLIKALDNRLEYFNAHHCRLSDHSFGYLMFAPASDAEVERIFASALAGKPVGPKEADAFRTAFICRMAKRYRELDWTMQLHFSVRRNVNPVALRAIGRDSGFDTIDNYAPVDQAAALLGYLEEKGALPRLILYNLDPSTNAAFDALCGCFQNSEAVCRVQHGSAWWFNDHLKGITEQLESFANLGYLAGFVGMLTDSRSFLSYPRHEYFRRILCRIIGEWVEDGQFPDDYDTLREIVAGVCYGNAKRYFRFASYEEV